MTGSLPGSPSPLKAAPGFRSHAAYPNISDGVPIEIQVTELRNTIGP